MPIKDISANELREIIKNKKDRVEIIDVRQLEEYKIIHIKGSKLIPLNELRDRLPEIDWNKEVIFICRSGSRSFIAASIAAAAGRDVKNLQRGIYECYADGKDENLEIDEEMIGRYF